MALRNYLPISVPEGWIEIQRIATRLEGWIYTIATDECNYFENINMEISSIEWKTFEEIEQRQERLAMHSVNQVSTLQQQNNVIPEMQSIMQIKRHEEEPSGTIENYCGIDRISNLSDDLLHNILSLLPAKEVVCTSVLSHRWYHLWTSVPCLNIDHNQFGAERDQQFHQFVDSILLKRCAPLEKLCLYSAGSSHSSFWINLAVRNNVKVIEYCGFGSSIEFPRLDGTILDLTSRCLKILRLSNVVVPYGIFDALNSSCLSLGDLELALCVLSGAEISSKSLVNLALIGCSMRIDVLICSPKLVSLIIKIPGERCPRFEKLQSIEEATISLDNLVHDGADEEDAEVYYSNILDSLSNAKSLELLAPYRELTFEKEMMNFPMFYNLTSLSLGEWCVASSFYPLTCFLWHSPQLRSLTLKLAMDECEYCSALEHGPMPQGGSFTSNLLTKVEITCVKGHKSVDKLVKMLRENARSIEELSVEEIEPSG